MKIAIRTDELAEETEVTITCKDLMPEIEKILSVLRKLDLRLVGRKGEETFLIDADQILYIDTVDKHTFLYTRKDVYESCQRLYELEEQLSHSDFFRANKSCIVNFRHIVSLKAEFYRRILVTMSKGEKLIISRQYADYVKQKLGVK